MKKIIVGLLIAGFLSIMLSACGGGYGGGRAYFRSDYGYGPWRGHPRYIDHRPIIIPPDGGGGDLEAVPLPEPPIDMPEPEAMPMDMDMGMPEIDIGL
jgi:hypothetical protein